MKLFIYARVTLEYFNFKRVNEFKRLSTSITTPITAVEQLLEEMRSIHI